MPRLPPCDRNSCNDAQRDFFDLIAGGARAKAAGSRSLIDAQGGLVGPFNAWVHRPDIGARWSALGEALRFGSTLPPDLFELAVLTVAAQSRCAYEWAAHKPHALRAEIPEAAIDAIGRGDRPAFEDAAQDEVFAFAHALAATTHVPQDVYDRLFARFGAATMVELVSVVGYYKALAISLNAFAVPPPPGFPAPWQAQSEQAGAGTGA